MLIITIYADAPAGMTQGTKEAIAQRLEDLGNIYVKKVEEIRPEQLVMESIRANEIHHTHHA